jgi:predicted enzyme related to lactoylglutathione lyase
VFGWDVFLDEQLGFYRVRPPSGSNPAQGFVFTLRRAKLPFVAVYIAVDDIHAKARAVVEHGGNIVQGPEEPVPGSLVCLFNEPSGVCFAMIQQRQQEGAGAGV